MATSDTLVPGECSQAETMTRAPSITNHPPPFNNEKKSSKDGDDKEGDGNASGSLHESVAQADDSDSDDNDDVSGRCRSEDSQRGHADAHSRSRSRARSFISRSLSRHRSRARSTADNLEMGPPVTRTVSEVRDGILCRRDVEIDGIEREKQDESEGVDEKRNKGQTSRPLAEAATSPAAAPSAAVDDGANLVKWEGPDDPGNPKNWSMRKKWMSVFFVSLFTLISPVSSSMIAPALPQIGRDLHITSSVEQLVAMSIFILAYAVGPLFLGPLSELYGRVVVLQLSNLVYLFFNLGCGLARTRGEMIAFRFLAGFGGSAPLAIGGGVLGDLFTAEERGRALSMYSLAPLLGPAIGPIAGAFVVENTSWRWVFYATSMADAAIQGAGLFFLRETYAPVLLRWKRQRLVKTTGNTALHTSFDSATEGISLTRTLATAMKRPFIMLGTQPIVQMLALYMIYLYGLMYLQLANFPALWRDVYHEPIGTGGLNYIALGVGFTLGAQLLAPLQDRVYARLKRRYRVSVGRPEFRVPVMVPGSLLVPIGLLIFGWCAEKRTHWIGPDIGIAIMAMGVICGFQCIQGYLVDTYTRYAASAVGATTVMRSLGGFGLPLAAPKLFTNLGYGKGSTLLAALGIVIGWPAPFLLWKYGPYLRTRRTAFQG